MSLDTDVHRCKSATAPKDDQILRPKTIINLGLIRDLPNPISRSAKLEAIIIQGAFEAGGPGHETTGFTELDDTPTETVKSEPQASDAMRTSQTQPSPSSATP